MTNYPQRGRLRERQVAERLREEGWVVLKGTSFGICDLAAMKVGHRPELIEVKSDVDGPYANFRKEQRRALVIVAEMAGADAVLAWWPPRGTLRFIASAEWPA